MPDLTVWRPATFDKKPPVSATMYHTNEPDLAIPPIPRRPDPVQQIPVFHRCRNGDRFQAAVRATENSSLIAHSDRGKEIRSRRESAMFTDLRRDSFPSPHGNPS